MHEDRTQPLGLPSLRHSAMREALNQERQEHGRVEDVLSGRQLHDVASVSLVNMPWASTNVPSIQCGLLKVELSRFGVHADVHYLNMDLAAQLGSEIYKAIASLPGERLCFFGEWLFGVAAFGPRSDDEEYLELFGIEQLCKQVNIPVDKIREFREYLLPEWIRACAGEASWGTCSIVGFTSTFEQNVASLALARRLKETYPGITTVFGGANFEGDMGIEYVRAFPWIDYAVLGEGDIAFPELVTRLSEERDPSGIPGVSHRVNGKTVRAGQPSQVRDMNTLPVPDYSDYFEALARLGRRSVVGHDAVRLLYESSRGCWWGEKHHCTFCGLNGLGMQFRSKSPDMVVADIRELTDTYKVLHISAVDNILDMSYLSSVCSELSAESWDLKMFYEVKANLTADQLKILRTAGIRTIQPGIESLNSHILALMRKGSSLMINLRLLKWAQYHNLRVIWNILMGFPGETDQDYVNQIELIPSLHHLRPPGECDTIALHRFSPYFSDKSFPIREVKPRVAYWYLYPPGVDLEQIAYFFDYRAEGIASRSVRARLTSEVKAWQRAWAAGNPPILQYERGPSWLRLTDTRGDHRREATINGWHAILYEYCGDSAHTLSAIQEHLSNVSPEKAGENEIIEFIRVCLSDRIMVCDNGQYFSLALPVGSRTQPGRRARIGGRDRG
jgi:ribosomal peptide maturation radical SAM protein 1